MITLINLCVQELPDPLPVRTRLPPELFGDALMVLEFLKGFGEIFDLKDEFPEGIALGEPGVLTCLHRGGDYETSSG